MTTFLLGRRTILAATLVVAATLSTSTVLADAQIYSSTVACTTWVLTKVDGKTSSGTGVLVDAEKKLVITNFHVVGEARSAIIFFADMKDGKPVTSRTHYVDNV